ncbi:DUF3089 domain-containing protein [Caulobacter sp. NIBR2454]|uniref:DUF3089 domain-containing protein n=1 Tax=Caulobacter sp. NIBR2454 TaxID=3015996 RepID=UPI0022B653D6|nr:DUF3089 domain-containing protein [Caulobacter sp. NIBR2454]
MRRFNIIGSVALLALCLTHGASASASAPLDYRQAENWVCRPDKPGACKDDLTALVIEADGTARREVFVPAVAPKVDCFYVYPTVSNSPGVSALPAVTEEERRAVRQQFARLSSVCRLFAPIYRQITVTQMKAAGAGKPLPGVREAMGLAQADVEAAWDAYLIQHNHGRGVVLIGHSQGAAILGALMRKDIDGKPVQAQLLSAILPGSWVMAPTGKDVGGTFKSIPACRTPSQIGCVIVFNAYRADNLIPPDKIPKFSDEAPLCTNPAALPGGPGVLKPYLSTSGETIIPDLTAPQGPWTRASLSAAAPFVTLPGFYVAECENDEHGVHLSVTPTPKPDDQRTGNLTGEWIMNGKPDVTMGLHLIDLNLVMGNLIEVIAAQAAAYIDQSAK